MVPYSARLVRMVAALVVLTLLGLVTAAWWQRSAQTAAGSVFRPEERISRIEALVALMGQAQPQGTDTAAVPAGVQPLEQSCAWRLRALMQARLMARLGLDAVASDQWLRQAWLAAHAKVGHEIRCADFAVDLSWALGSREVVLDGSPDALQAIPRLLSENLQWTRGSACLEAATPTGRVLLLGNPVACGASVDWQLASGLPRDGSFAAMAAELALRSRPLIRPEDHERQATWALTLNLPAQRHLDRLRGCLEGAVACPAFGFDPSLAGSVSVVLMNADSGDVLGMLCHGSRCRTPALAPMGQLAALLVESPPASTTKLVHALALARQPAVTDADIRNQIKTSGQVDGTVSKRNEWWERQVICDDAPGKAAPGGAAPLRRGCTVMRQARHHARELGFNQGCEQPNAPGCGRAGLADPDRPHWIPGFIGRLALPDVGPAEGFLPWRDYDAVRQGRAKPPTGAAGQKAYWATAQAVQSVIGGGDARIGALGLAHMGAALHSLGQGKPAPQPALLRRQGADTASPAAPSAASAQLRAAARTVVAGMAAAVEPEQAGWVGEGTAARAVRAAFGKNCAQACGLAVKTGTVSFKDPVSAGATLMVAMVDVDRLSAWAGAQPSVLAGQRLAMGVIVQPPASGARVHAASLLGMGLLRGLFEP